MKDIKTKECKRAPKLKAPVSRMSKELMRDAVLKAKEKPRCISEAGTSMDSQESPVEYASRKIASAEDRAVSVTASAVSSAGRNMVKKSCGKIREQRREQAAAENTGESVNDVINESINDGTNENINATAKDGIKKNVKERTVPDNPDILGKTGTEKAGSGADRIKTKAKHDQAVDMRGIKVKRSQREMLHLGSGKAIKTIPRGAGPSKMPANEIRTGLTAVQKRQAGYPAMQKKQLEYAAKASRQMAVKSVQAAGETAKTVKKTTETAVRGVVTAVKAAASSTKFLSAVAAAGGGLAILLILVVGVIGGVLFSSSSQSAGNGSDAVQ